MNIYRWWRFSHSQTHLPFSMFRSSKFLSIPLFLMQGQSFFFRCLWYKDQSVISSLSKIYDITLSQYITSSCFLFSSSCETSSPNRGGISWYWPLQHVIYPNLFNVRPWTWTVVFMTMLWTVSDVTTRHLYAAQISSHCNMFWWNVSGLFPQPTSI